MLIKKYILGLLTFFLCTIPNIMRSMDKSTRLAPNHATNTYTSHQKPEIPVHITKWGLPTPQKKHLRIIEMPDLSLGKAAPDSISLTKSAKREPVGRPTTILHVLVPIHFAASIGKK